MARHRLPIRSRDSAEDAIVDLLRLSRAQVFRLDPYIKDAQSAGFPDLAVFHGGCLYLAEVKSPGGVLKPQQKVFAAQHQAWLLEDFPDVTKMLISGHRCYTPIKSPKEG